MTSTDAKDRIFVIRERLKACVKMTNKIEKDIDEGSESSYISLRIRADELETEVRAVSERVSALYTDLQNGYIEGAVK